MKRVLTFFLVSFLVFNIAGCAGLQKKFTRKKKDTVKMPHFYKYKEYESKPTPELYKKHYVYWESFQSEMIATLGSNSKKNSVCIEHILSNLSDMRNMLLPEKAAEMNVHIERLIKVKDILKKEDLTQFNRNYIMMTLERESRYIKRNFVYGKVKNSLRASYEGETDITADQSKSQGVADGQIQPAK